MSSACCAGSPGSSRRSAPSEKASKPFSSICSEDWSIDRSIEASGASGSAVPAGSSEAVSRAVEYSPASSPSADASVFSVKIVSGGISSRNSAPAVCPARAAKTGPQSEPVSSVAASNNASNFLLFIAPASLVLLFFAAQLCCSILRTCR